MRTLWLPIIVSIVMSAFTLFRLETNENPAISHTRSVIADNHWRLASDLRIGTCQARSFPDQECVIGTVKVGSCTRAVQADVYRPTRVEVLFPTENGVTEYIAIATPASYYLTVTRKVPYGITSCFS